MNQSKHQDVVILIQSWYFKYDPCLDDRGSILGKDNEGIFFPLPPHLAQL
jgi:hypothetical protein